MKRWAAAVLLFLAAPPGFLDAARGGPWRPAADPGFEAAPGDSPRAAAGLLGSAPLEAEGALYYDRGHYWIEIAFRGPEGRDTIPTGLAAAQFEIATLGGKAAVFRPSRAEAAADGDRRYIILFSSRLEGRACYRVAFTPTEGAVVVADSLCDPFAVSPSPGDSRGGSVRRALAALFAQSADPWRLNALSYEYDLSQGRSSARLAVDPRLRAGSWAIEGSLRFGESGTLAGGKRLTAADRQTFSLALSKASWSHRMRFAVAALCRLDRLSWGGGSGDSSLAEATAAIEGRIRFDDLFDGMSGSRPGVLKGIEAAFGYEWHETVGAGEAGGRGFERIAPFASARGTWTVFDAAQLSYAIESRWPAGIREAFTEFHSLRVRLLLRDALESPAGRSYHPDVELAWDAGRRPPLFCREERVSIGFVFDLYPW